MARGRSRTSGHTPPRSGVPCGHIGKHDCAQMGREGGGPLLEAGDRPCVSEHLPHQQAMNAGELASGSRIHRGHDRQDVMGLCYRIHSSTSSMVQWRDVLGTAASGPDGGLCLRIPAQARSQGDAAVQSAAKCRGLPQALPTSCTAQDAARILQCRASRKRRRATDG